MPLLSSFLPRLIKVFLFIAASYHFNLSRNGLNRTKLVTVPTFNAKDYTLSLYFQMKQFFGGSILNLFNWLFGKLFILRSTPNQ